MKSKKLEEILRLMNSGWELGCGHSGGYWLQKGGIGRGGECIWIHGRTNVYLLRGEDLIAPYGKEFPTQKYHLTDKGKEYIYGNFSQGI